MIASSDVVAAAYHLPSTTIDDALGSALLIAPHNSYECSLICCCICFIFCLYICSHICLYISYNC
ncbi:hypothetical protein C175_26338 [Bacillus cereus]|nr:hypothetical protein C175_26338 [Bacillus cereus]